MKTRFVSAHHTSGSQGQGQGRVREGCTDPLVRRTRSEIARPLSRVTPCTILSKDVWSSGTAPKSRTGSTGNA